MQAKISNRKENFAGRLSLLISNSGLKKGDVAKALGVRPATISGWLSEKSETLPDQKNVDRLAELFSVDAKFIAYGNSENFAVAEPPARYGTDRPMLRPTGGPPNDDADPTTRDELEMELSYYLDRAERAGALAVAAYHIRRYLDPGQFDFMQKKLKPHTEKE